MRVTWNGVGSAWATENGNASAVIESQGQRLLFDCGHTVPSRLHLLNLSLADIPAVFISHLHGDHLYGLEEFGFRSFLIWKRKPVLFIAKSLALPLWRNVLSGTMGRAGANLMLLRDYFDIHVLAEDKPYVYEPWTITIHSVRHIPNVACYGARIEADGATVSFTADSLADADPFFYKDSQAVFHDCSFRPYAPGTVHAHFSQVEQYPEEFRRKTFLVHYDDDTRKLLETTDLGPRLEASGMRLTQVLHPYEFNPGGRG